MKGADWISTEQISRFTVAEVSQSSKRLDESEQSLAQETMPEISAESLTVQEKDEQDRELAKGNEPGKLRKVGSEMRAGGRLLPAAFLGWDGGNKDNKADILPFIS